MTPEQLKQCLISLFDPDKLERFPREWVVNLRGNGSISKLGYCTNLTPETVEQAVRHEVDFILTHHDAWQFLHGMPEACAAAMEEHGIGNAFFHLLLDDADFGTSATLAERLGLRGVEKSTPYEGVFYCGRAGEWETAKTFQEAKVFVEGVVGEPVRAWMNHDRPIRRVGVAAGGGMMASDVKEAVNHGCDVYVTGEKTLYTVEYARFAGIDLFIGTHTGTELPGVESLARQVAGRFPETQIVRLLEDTLE